MISIALYQPDIPQNAGAMLRLCACTGVKLEIIEPCGFPWDDKKIQRAGMDYIEQASYERHSSWGSFKTYAGPRRIILMTTKVAETACLPRESGGLGHSSQRSLLSRGMQEETYGLVKDYNYLDFKFEPSDILLAGRESAGVPTEIHAAADARIMIPMHPGTRSLNIVNATAMILGEALRQTNGFI